MAAGGQTLRSPPSEQLRKVLSTEGKAIASLLEKKGVELGDEQLEDVAGGVYVNGWNIREDDEEAWERLRRELRSEPSCSSY